MKIIVDEKGNITYTEDLDNEIAETVNSDDGQPENDIHVKTIEERVGELEERVNVILMSEDKAENYEEVQDEIEEAEQPV